MALCSRSCFHNEFLKIVIVLIWILINITAFSSEYYKYCFGWDYVHLYEMLGRSLCVSRASAHVININCCLILIPMYKTILSWIRSYLGKPLRSRTRRLMNHTRRAHVAIAYWICILAVIHTVGHGFNFKRFYDNFSSKYPDLNVLEHKKMCHRLKFSSIDIRELMTNVPLMTGIAMIIILIILVLSSLPVVRRQKYEVFWYTHHLGLVFLGLLIAHGLSGVIKHQTKGDHHHHGCDPHGHAPNSTLQKKCIPKPVFEPDVPMAWKWISLSILLYIVERILRIIRARGLVKVTKMLFHKGNIIELRMIKSGFVAYPGQYVLLKCLDVASFQWHPFTITKCPTYEDEEFTVHVKMTGGWTEALSKQFDSMVMVNNTVGLYSETCNVRIEKAKDVVVPIEESQPFMRIQVDGPYGSPCQDMTNFRKCVCIGGGIGVTPFIAVVNELRHKKREKEMYGKIEHLHFIWVCRTTDDVSVFFDVLYAASRELNTKDSPVKFYCSLFITRQKDLSFEEYTEPTSEWLKSVSSQGRPDWEKQLESIPSNHERERVGVFYCGPKPIAKILHKACNRIKKNGNTFIFHKESF